MTCSRHNQLWLLLQIKALSRNYGAYTVTHRPSQNSQGNEEPVKPYPPLLFAAYIRCYGFGAVSKKNRSNAKASWNSFTVKLRPTYKPMKKSYVVKNVVIIQREESCKAVYTTKKQYIHQPNSARHRS